jgi:hypothetical protein
MTAAGPQAVPPLPAVEHFGPALARLAFGMMRHARPPLSDAPHIVMILAPWYRQACGWFAVALGIALATRGGARVTFLIDDLPYPAIHPRELDEVLAFEAFCREFEAMYPYHRLSTFAGADSPERRAVIDGAVEAALQLDLRHRSGAGTLPAGQRGAFARSARTPLTHVARAVDGFLAAIRPDAIFCPGGVANGSYAVTHLAAAHGVRLASVDSAYGRLYVAAHGIAGQLTELADAYAHVLTLRPNLVEIARAEGFALLEKKIAAAASAGPLPPCDLLLPLGYDWDTVALGVGSLYADQAAWLNDTIDHVSRQHPRVRMVVRQHPYELTVPCPENDALLESCAARGLSTLVCMRAADRTPPYGLFRGAKAVVACQSAMVLESQMRGVPSLALRDNYFIKSGALARPHSREAYFQWIDRHLSGPRATVAESSSAAAALLYFLLETAAIERTRFTPHASDLWAWLHGDPIGDLLSPMVADVVRAVVRDVPLSILKARRTLGLDPLPPGIDDPIAA